LRDSKERNKNTKYYVAGGGLAVILIITAFVAFSAMSPWSYWWDEDEAPTVKTVSTFTLYSAVDGEDVSNFATMDIWVPKSGVDFDEGYEDITDLVVKFEREETGKDADDISLDLRSYEYVWAEVVGNSVWGNTFYLLIGGVNYDYKFYAHHSSPAVPFNILDRDTMINMTIKDEPTPSEGYGVIFNGNYTAVLGVESMVTGLAGAVRHYGDDWALSTTEFGELSLRNQEAYYEQRNWCDQYPRYDPTADTNNEFEREFETITNAFALKIVMNASMNMTDSLSTTQVNVTLGRGVPAEVVIAGTALYIIFYEGFNFLDGAYRFDFELQFARNISVYSAYTGRVNVPASASSVSAWAVYNEIGLVA